MAAKVCAKRPLRNPPLFPARGVDSPAMENSFFGPMVAEEWARGEPDTGPGEAVLGAATRRPGKGHDARRHLAPATRGDACARPRPALSPCHHGPSTASGSDTWFLTRSGQMMCC